MLLQKDKNVVYALTCFCILHTTSYWSNIRRVQSTQNVKYHFANFPSAWLIYKAFHLLMRLHMMINSLNFMCCLFQFKTRFCNIKKFFEFTFLLLNVTISKGCRRLHLILSAYINAYNYFHILWFCVNWS